MIGLFDQWILVVLVALPLAAALFVLAMPSHDRLALRYVGMGALIVSGVCAIAAATRVGRHALVEHALGVTLSLDALSAPLLLTMAWVGPVALRAGASRVQERSQFFVVNALFAQTLWMSALLVDEPMVKLALASIATIPWLAIVALAGGAQRGTTTFRTAIQWLLVDAVALAAIVYLTSLHARGASMVIDSDALVRVAQRLSPTARAWLFLALAAPALVRLAAGPFSVWLQGLFDEAPVSAAALAAGCAAPLGVNLFVSVALPLTPDGAVAWLLPMVLVAVVAVGVSGLIAVAERDLRRLLTQLLQMSGTWIAVALWMFDSEAWVMAHCVVAATGITATSLLVTLEAVERRFESRSVVDLAGALRGTPILGALLVVPFLGLCGIPGLGAGTWTWLMLERLAKSSVFQYGALPGVAWLWVVGCAAVAFACALFGVAGLARRAWVPSSRPTAVPLGVTPAQAMRLLLPAVAFLVFGIWGDALVRDAQPQAQARIDKLQRRAFGGEQH